MSGTEAQNSLYKSVLATEMDQELSNLSFSLCYPLRFDVGNEKLPGPLPPLPAWMLDTPMHSKLPMVPAPRGRIVLFTTGLGKKLHQIPDDLDFDPVAAGLGWEYKSLHDPHLKSYYTRHVKYDRLVKSGHITTDGMVKCTLKEFNDYHQYLKSLRVEKNSQERKRRFFDEKERLSHKRRQSIQKDVSDRDKLIKESLLKQKKVRAKERRKLSRKLQSDYQKTIIRLLADRREKTALMQSRRKASEEKHHTIMTTLEAEDKLKKMMITTKRTAEEIRRADYFKVKRKREKEERARKLEDQWDRRELARAKRLMREAKSLAQKKDDMYQKVEIREEKVAKHRERLQDIFTQIRDERQKTAISNEDHIAARLEKILDSLCHKYIVGHKRGRRRFPPINPKLTTNMTTWNVHERENQRKQERASNIGSTDRLPPITSSDFSREILTIIEESERQSKVSVVSMGDAPVSLPEVLDSFTLVARQLVSKVCRELRSDPEFKNVEWEEGDTRAKRTTGVERPDYQEFFIDAADVSPHASMMVANALNDAMNHLDESQPTLVEPTEVSPHASLMVANALTNAMNHLQESQPTFVEPTEVSPHASLMVANALKNAVKQLQESKPTLVKPKERNPHASQMVANALKSVMSKLQKYQSTLVKIRERARSIVSSAIDGALQVRQRSLEVNEIVDIFQEPPESTVPTTHTQASSDSESEAEEEDDAVIGIVENPILMDESIHAGGPAGDMDVDEGLHVVMHKAQDGHLIVEGAVLTAEHDKQTITERILSDITLERVSGSLSGASSSRSGLAREEAPPSSSSSSEDEEEVVQEDHSFIVPIYQKNLINVGSELVESHLSAISMKPEANGKFPTKGKCAARNSFRNIFRPDMTYCQGSARMLRDTLVKDIRSRQTASVPTGMDMVCEVLEQEEQDIMEKHSDEALVKTEETEGLCYLPIKKKPRPVAPAVTAPVQVDTKPSEPPLVEEVAATEPTEDPKPSLSSADPTVGDDASPLATSETAKAANSDKTSTEQNTGILPSSKSATEARERALSAERQSTKREVSAQSVHASPNLAGSDEGSVADGGLGEDPGARKHASCKSKMVTRSSGLISGVMSRLSHVFSGSRKKSNASVPSHESSSEPASRQSSKKSVEGMTGGALSEGAQAQGGTASGEESNLTAGDVHHGASVHFTSLTVDPPVKKESIYAAHRPKTPIPHVDVSIDDEDDGEEEVVIEEGNTEDVAKGEAEDVATVSIDTHQTSEDLTNPEAPIEHHLQIENDSNNANTESGSRPPSRLPFIGTSQLEPPLVPSENASSWSQGQDGPARFGSRTSQDNEGLMPPPIRSPSDRSISGAQSMTINGRSLTPIGSKTMKSVTSTTGKEKRRSVGMVRPGTPSSLRGSRLSHHKRAASPQKRGSVSSQSASQVKSAYGSTVGFSVTGSQILPSKPLKSISMGSRRTSRTQAGNVSATDLGSRRGSHASKTGRRGSSMVMPRPPSGVKPSGSAKSGHRVVRQSPGAQATSNPALTTAKGSSSVIINNCSSADRLLPRRPSIEKENRMERLSTESVSSRRSSLEKVAKKKSSGTQPKKEQSLPDQKPAARMPPIKAPLTPRPPSQPRERSPPTSVALKGAAESASDAEQKILVNDQAASEE